MDTRNTDNHAAGSWATTEGVRRSMLANRSSDTGPEIALRKALHALGFRYRKHVPLVVGRLRTRPDILFASARVAVFVDGCFWHRCPVHATDPRANAEYWLPKLAANAARDRRVNDALAGAGWTVVRIWEHEAIDDAVARVTSAVERAAETSDSSVIQ
jgi:DNA mismatch endonuclease (patch repair protein)